MPNLQRDTLHRNITEAGEYTVVHYETDTHQVIDDEGNRLDSVIANINSNIVTPTTLEKETLADDDSIAIIDSEDSNVPKRTLLSTLKTTLSAIFSSKLHAVEHKTGGSDPLAATDIGAFPYKLYDDSYGATLNFNDIAEGESRVASTTMALTNTPDGMTTGSYYVYTRVKDASNKYQRAKRVGTSGTFYERDLNSGTWQPWAKLYSTLERPLARDVGGVTWTEYDNFDENDINNANFAYAYETQVSDSTSDLVGLPHGWWHLKYYKSADTGYGAQEAIAYGANTKKFRTSNGLTWNTWIDAGHLSDSSGNSLVVYEKIPINYTKNYLDITPLYARYAFTDDYKFVISTYYDDTAKTLTVSTYSVTASGFTTVDSLTITNIYGESYICADRDMVIIFLNTTGTDYLRVYNLSSTGHLTLNSSVTNLPTGYQILDSHSGYNQSYISMVLSYSGYKYIYRINKSTGVATLLQSTTSFSTDTQIQCTDTPYGTFILMTRISTGETYTNTILSTIDKYDEAGVKTNIVTKSTGNNVDDEHAFYLAFLEYDLVTEKIYTEALWGPNASQTCSIYTINPSSLTISHITSSAINNISQYEAYVYNGKAISTNSHGLDLLTGLMIPDVSVYSGLHELVSTNFYGTKLGEFGIQVSHEGAGLSVGNKGYIAISKQCYIGVLTDG